MYHDCQWLSLRPPVLRHSMSAGFPELDWPLPAGRVVRLIGWSWHMATPTVLEHHRRLAARFPEHVVHYLCNERREAEALRAAGLSALLVSHNAWVDDETFLPLPVEPQYEAIYVARFHPGKRHDLAAAIAGPVLLAGYSNRDYDPPGHLAAIRRACPAAPLRHRPDFGFLPHEEVAHLMNAARVGLCLSEVEGAMRVAVEYQLCGLPVVTVRNRGGRNEFLDPEFSRTVPPDPAAVAAAVRELASLDLPPHEVRAAVLRKLTAHRRRLLDLVQSIFRRRQGAARLQPQLLPLAAGRLPLVAANGGCSRRQGDRRAVAVGGLKRGTRTSQRSRRQGVVRRNRAYCQPASLGGLTVPVGRLGNQMSNNA